jgi:hypothetical protein
MSLAMGPLAPNVEEPTATDEWKVPSLVDCITCFQSGLDTIRACTEQFVGMGGALETNDTLH